MGKKKLKKIRELRLFSAHNGNFEEALQAISKHAAANKLVRIVMPNITKSLKGLLLIFQIAMRVKSI